MIAHPSGRVKGWAERTTIVAAYTIVLVPALAHDEWWTVWWATGLFGAFLVLVRRRTALARAAGLEALPAMAILWVTLAATATLLLALGDAPVAEGRATVAYQVGIVATVVVFAVRAAGWRRRTAEVADAVVEVTFGPGGSVRDLLADALRDPTVEVAFAVAGDGTRRWVDELGRPVASLSGAGRTVIPIRVDGPVVAELASQVDFDGLPDVLAAVEVGDRPRRQERRVCDRDFVGRSSSSRRRAVDCCRRPTTSGCASASASSARRARRWPAFTTSSTGSCRPDAARSPTPSSGVAPGWPASTSISMRWRPDSDRRPWRTAAW